MRDDDWIDSARLNVVVGHFGSGKTEFSINLALALAEKRRPFALADLDIVDPYFRSRECAELFQSRDIRLISSSQACLDADVPSMPPDVAVLFDNKGLYSVLDIGGDASGARVLARYRQRLKAHGARFLCVVNANRPLTDSPEKAAAYLRDIEYSVGLPINGIVSNTHLCEKIELQDILTGAAFATKVSEIVKVPVLCHMVPSHMAEEALRFVSPVFPVNLYMKKPWE